MKKLIFALIASATVMGAAQAQQAQQAPKGYVGVGIATADHDYSFSGVNGDSDGYKPSGKLYGGYEFDRTWAVEAGYTDFAKSDYNYTQNSVRGHGESDGHSIYLAAKATAPINDQFSAYGKLGVAQNKADFHADNPALNRDYSKTEAYGALGVEYKLNQQVSLTAEYERYGKSRDFGAKADVWTVGARYSF